MTDENRRMTLQNAVSGYVAQGFMEIDRSEWSVNLRKKKKFNWLAFIFCLGIFYLPFYWMRSSQKITVSIDTDGRILTV